MELMHAAFIAALKRRGWQDEHLNRDGEDYADFTTQMAWVGFVEGWQAVKP